MPRRRPVADRRCHRRHGRDRRRSPRTPGHLVAPRRAQARRPHPDSGGNALPCRPASRPARPAPRRARHGLDACPPQRGTDARGIERPGLTVGEDDGDAVVAAGAKNRPTARSESTPRSVPLPLAFSAGGGRCTPIDRDRVASKSARSSVGKRCGSTRSVRDASPTAAVGESAGGDAKLDDRSKRVGKRQALGGEHRSRGTEELRRRRHSRRRRRAVRRGDDGWAGASRAGRRGR